ncbi:MAG: carboxyl transferase domain-containing protein [Acidimicrobiales bacterium]
MSTAAPPAAGPPGFDPVRLLDALGLPVPLPGGGLPLARLDGGTGPAVTVAAALTPAARAVAAQRGTPLLVVVPPPGLGPARPDGAPARPDGAPARPDGNPASGVAASGVASTGDSAAAVGGGASAAPILAVRGATAGTGSTGNGGGVNKPWPVVVAASSPWAVAGADCGLLVGEQGPADRSGLDEPAAADLIRRFLDLSVGERPVEPAPAGPSLIEIVPFAVDAAYDPEAVLAAVVDGGRWVELAAGAAPEVLTVVARIGGRPVGVTMSRPAGNGGLLTPAGCARVERLLDWCERGGRPWVSLVDTAGVETGADAISQEALRRAAARARSAEVTKLAVVVGRAVGLAATVLGAVGARADLVLPWPRARLSLTPPPPDLDPAEAGRLAAADRAATEGDLLDVIHPDETRARLIELLDLVRGRREYGERPGVAQ